jgi:hypothetical protein
VQTSNWGEVSSKVVTVVKIFPRICSMSQPHFWKSVRMTLTLPKWGLGNPSRLLKLQSSIAGVKTPCSTSYGKKKGQESNWQFDSRPLKVGNQLDSDVCRWNATHHWKALKESYKFASNLIPIEGLNKELWTHKILGVQIGIVSGLLLGSPRTKSHSDVGAAE